jgi:Lipocalin-like domain
VEEIMKRLCLGIIVAIGLTLPAFGQQGALKEQLVGVWTLVSCEGTFDDGTKLPWCISSTSSTMILDASGRYATIIAVRGRPKFTDANRPRSALSAEEFKAAAVGFVANFGTWSVNEADKTATYHYDGALFPNAEGTDNKFTVSVSGDELKQGTAVWRRIKR